MIIAEIGDISAFESPEKLSKYAGVVPTTFQSGIKIVEGITMKKEVHGRPSHRCNKRLKYILGISAQTIVDSRDTDLTRPLQQFYKRICRTHKDLMERQLRSLHFLINLSK